MGTLYVVGTPIGNLGDITLRALRVLREVGLIAAEDTRRTALLLRRYQISTPMVSYYAPKEHLRIPQLLEVLASQDVALVSESGMPAISDPGYPLVKAAIEAGFAVVPIPGPSALLAALAVSGLPTDQFVYLGFLPRRRKERQRLLSSLVAERRTLVAFEAPHRLVATLQDLLVILGERRMAVARELTKLNEEIFRGSVSQTLKRFEENRPKGEFTLVIEGAPQEGPWDEAKVREVISLLKGEGLSPRELAAEVARKAFWPRRRVYQLALEMEDEDGASG